MPTLLDPRELLDGALVNGAFDWAAIRNPTFYYQRNTLVRSLLREHGRRLRFAGVVVAPGVPRLGHRQGPLGPAVGARWRSALGADAAIVTAFSSGNSHTDVMLAVRACERAGIRTACLLCETNGGLTDHVAEADAIVSAGNEDELAPGWAPERVLGGCAPASRLGRHRGEPRSRTAPTSGRPRRRATRRLRAAVGMRAVHYVNQFFAGLGGEEAAQHGPVRLEARSARAGGSACRSWRRWPAATTTSPSTRTRRWRSCSPGWPSSRLTCWCAGRRSARAATATPAACWPARPAGSACPW